MLDYSLCEGTKQDLCQTCLRKTDPKILVKKWRTWFTHTPIKSDNTCELFIEKPKEVE